jgi:hypothetical protein
MQFAWGSYAHTMNSVAFRSISRNLVPGQTGRISRLSVNWQLDGKLIGTSQADIMQQLATMQQAYSINGQNAAMLDNNGAIIQPWYLNSAQSLGGVLVTSPISHGGVYGAEGNTYLKYTFGLTADFIAANGLMSFQETVTFTDIGGGPMKTERQPVQGLPIQQTVTETSPYYCTQSGSLTQNYSGPQAQGMYFPGNLRGHPNAKRIAYLPTKTMRGSPYEWGISWAYDYFSATGFSFGGAVVRG